LPIENHCYNRPELCCTEKAVSVNAISLTTVPAVFSCRVGNLLVAAESEPA
jgi:hypothetical protein